MTENIFSKICIELGSFSCQRGDYALTYMLYSTGFSGQDMQAQKALASALQKLAALHAERGKTKEATKAYKKALAIYKNMPVIDENGVQDVLDQLGQLYSRQGRFAQAILAFEQAMKIDEGLQIKDHERIKNRMNQIIWLQLRQGTYPEAQNAYGQTEQIECVQVRRH